VEIRDVLPEYGTESFGAFSDTTVNMEARSRDGQKIDWTDWAACWRLDCWVYPKNTAGRPHEGRPIRFLFMDVMMA